MKRISSRENPRYKELKRLAASPAARHQAGVTLLDGLHLCETWLNRLGMPAECIVAQSELAQGAVATLLERVDPGLIVVLDDALFGPLAQVEHGPRILFLIDVPQPVAPERLDGPWLLLDRVQDPGNMGSMLRSAAAAGIRHVLCSQGCVAAWSPKVLRAGMGAHFELSIHENADLADWLRRFDCIRKPVCATSSHATGSLFETDVREASWLFGNEGQGVSAALLESGVQALRIPQPGGMESLNVAAAAAICLFEQVRQNAVKVP